MTLEQVIAESAREKLLKIMHGDVGRRCVQRLRGVRASEGQQGGQVLRVELDVLVPSASELRLLKGRGKGPLRALAKGVERDVRAHTGAERVVLAVHAGLLKGQAARAFRR